MWGTGFRGLKQFRAWGSGISWPASRERPARGNGNLCASLPPGCPSTSLEPRAGGAILHHKQRRGQPRQVHSIPKITDENYFQARVAALQKMGFSLKQSTAGVRKYPWSLDEAATFLFFGGVKASRGHSIRH